MDGVKVADVDRDGREDLLVGWEQGKVVRLYFQPENVLGAWPFVEFACPDVEDAFFADVNADGALDVVCCCEGETQQMVFFLSPSRKSQLSLSKHWKKQPVEVTAGRRWVQGVAQAGDHGELILGAKGEASGIFSLSQDKAGAWQLKKIAECGWPMSVDLVDVDGDGSQEVVGSSGTEPGVGVFVHKRVEGEWVSQKLSKGEEGYGFLSYWKTEQGLEIFAPARLKGLCHLSRRGAKWQEEWIDYPPNCGKGKASACADLDGDGNVEVVVNFGAADDKQGLIYLKKGPAGWQSFNVCGMKGNKFDNILLLDVDRDGDLDIITCEENRNSSTVPGLGLIWYENPAE